MAKNHPKGLIVLALANMGERFGYYTMLAILALYMQAKFGFSSATTSLIYGTFLALVYFLPVFGGIVADKWLGYGKTILIGITIMFAGYLLLGIPFGTDSVGILFMSLSLILISAGTGLFKGNLQALVGKLYDNPLYSKNRDMAFSIFYMFINIGAFFAPSMGNTITNSVLAKENFYYDASIPRNYVALNDKVVDADQFVAEYARKHPHYSGWAADKQDEAIAKAKKKAGVMFAEDEAKVLFNLKLAGLHQYTKAGKISDPALMVTSSDYEIINSRDAADAAKKEQILARVAAAEVTDPVLLASTDSKGFERDFGNKYVTELLSTSYSWAFFVACGSLIISILIFFVFRSTWKSADVTAKQAKAAAAKGEHSAVEMSPKEVKERLLALGLVFLVVIFFWMAFHQNGLTMTFFARDYTESKVSPNQFMAFSLVMLIPFICFMYGVYLSSFGLLGGKRNAKTGLILIVLGIAGLVGGYFLDIASITEATKSITPQIFQQFNPFFIILLTPVTVGFFTYLSRRDREPSAPRKIGIGMLLAAVGFLVLLVGSIGLPAPSDIEGTSSILVSPNVLIGTYFVLTLAELFLSPMGLSFVSKVAPPQYAGLMQGGWLAATAVGNLLVGVMGSFWEKMSLVAFWGVLIACCLLSAAFIFSVMKRLERVTA
ncbi:TGF-beta receptor type I/II [Porphyromonas crevioricanis]|uniref:Di-/tripeptide transporter n=2 Tax=Porphyromonas crevioricanis TaxID=393921 RepID=A0A0A2FHY4_9PORP|nr:peptide MFS transporter [Porphyromonas crevioricanis]KGN89732.1 TGF-beta receptor type I/II [Porphyromonas crevioricanis]KGN93732.1 TGF-beta receptor type I/II [Porphyromonas crevioricanis]SJZ76372.1 proton-dependent oligopeptide transporter, POT family [Porphyromonas crevioricanis]SQH72318.1 Di-/tripeptide transporter [Porphyromonas crevioricanis]GAD04451.1 di-/tripeptide transporter [Porphyromonas crevioricanis JCM 15906]